MNDLNDFDEAGGRLNATVPVAVHHHIQDGGSSDGTIEFLQKFDAEVRCQQSEVRDPNTEHLKLNTAVSSYTFSYESAPDNGMYDAINKGWSRADESWDWLGHLNSDEQYQPGVLARIAQAGRVHPSWGAITGNCVWVDEDGCYLCSRKPSVGWPWVGRIWIPASTCALFIRRKFFGEKGARFDTSWKSFGDKVFCRDLLNAGCRFGYLDDYMAVFIHRGTENLGFQPITEVERKRYWDEVLTPRERALAPLSIFAAKVSKFLRGTFGKNCRSYVWIDSSGERRAVDVGVFGRKR